MNALLVCMVCCCPLPQESSPPPLSEKYRAKYEACRDQFGFTEKEISQIVKRSASRREGRDSLGFQFAGEEPGGPLPGDTNMGDTAGMELFEGINGNTTAEGFIVSMRSKAERLKILAGKRIWKARSGDYSFPGWLASCSDDGLRVTLANDSKTVDVELAKLSSTANKRVSEIVSLMDQFVLQQATLVAQHLLPRYYFSIGSEGSGDRAGDLAFGGPGSMMPGMGMGGMGMAGGSDKFVDPFALAWVGDIKLPEASQVSPGQRLVLELVLSGFVDTPEGMEALGVLRQDTSGFTGEESIKTKKSPREKNSFSGLATDFEVKEELPSRKRGEWEKVLLLFRAIEKLESSLPASDRPICRISGDGVWIVKYGIVKAVPVAQFKPAATKAFSEVGAARLAVNEVIRKAVAGRGVMVGHKKKVYDAMLAKRAEQAARYAKIEKARSEFVFAGKVKFGQTSEEVLKRVGKELDLEEKNQRTAFDIKMGNWFAGSKRWLGKKVIDGKPYRISFMFFDDQLYQVKQLRWIMDVGGADFSAKSEADHGLLVENALREKYGTPTQSLWDSIVNLAIQENKAIPARSDSELAEWHNKTFDINFKRLNTKSEKNPKIVEWLCSVEYRWKSAAARAAQLKAEELAKKGDEKGKKDLKDDF